MHGASPQVATRSSASAPVRRFQRLGCFEARVLAAATSVSAMPRSIFLSYAGRTVKAPFEGTSVADLQSCFTEQFPHSRSQFVFYVTDPKTQVPYEVSDVADIGDGMEVEVKLCDESGHE